MATLSRRSVLFGLPLAAVGVGAFTAGRTPMFETEVIATGVSPHATFWSGGQKLARNGHGRMMAFLVSQNAAYDAQAAEIWFEPEGGTRTLVLSPAGAINPPVVEAAASGEFFAVWCDWIAGKVHVAVWDDIAANPVPVVKSYAQGGLSGKWSAVWSELRRALLVMNNGNGKLLVFSDTGDLISERAVIGNSPTAALQYPFLTMTPDGWLAIAACSSDLGIALTSYRSIIGGWSPDLIHFAPFTKQWRDWSKATTGWESLPVPADNGAMLVSRGEEMGWSCLLSAFHVDEDYAHIVYAAHPERGGKFYAQGGEDVSLCYQRFDAKTGERMFRAPLIIEGFEPWMVGGFLTCRGNTLYHLIPDGLDLVLTALPDSNTRWQIVDRFTLPGSGFAHYLSGWRGDVSDGTIEGVVTVIDCALDDWVNGVGFPQPSSVVRFALTV